MKQRLVIRPCYCDRITKAIDAYIRKADNDLSKQLGKISIHALREEGDVLWRTCHGAPYISIHALREEGDSKNRDKISIFL